MLARIALLAALLAPVSAFAQQPAPQQMSPSQIAIAITSSVNQLAQAVDQLLKENAELKKQLEARGANTQPEAPK